MFCPFALALRSLPVERPAPFLTRFSLHLPLLFLMFLEPTPLLESVVTRVSSGYVEYGKELDGILGLSFCWLSLLIPIVPILHSSCFLPLFVVLSHLITKGEYREPCSTLFYSKDS